MIQQQYHLEPDRGLLNDPNGLAWFNGKYHVFFQWNRFEKNHSYKEWGLFTSKNLINWEFEESALLPDLEYDKDGVYSGIGYVIDKCLYLFYTGNCKNDGKRKSSQCLVVTKDGRKYLKKGIILETPDEYTEHFRDPKVSKCKEKGYYMVIGAQQKTGKGAIALCCSDNGKQWKYHSMLAESLQYEMIECPDLFEMDDRYVLLYNPQKRDNEKDTDIYSFSAYKIVDFDENTGMLKDTDLDIGFEKMDAGFDFYAPQTFLSPDGRRIMFGWMSRMEAEQEKIFSRTEKNIHCMTMPRELVLKDSKKLYQKPIREMYELLGPNISVAYKDNEWKAIPDRRTFWMHIKPTDGKKDLNVLFHKGEAEISYNSTLNELIFSRKNWVDGSKDIKTVEVNSLEELEIWSDNSSLEIFVNYGANVFSARIFPDSNNLEIVVKGDIQEEEIKIRKINNTKKEETK